MGTSPFDRNLISWGEEEEEIWEAGGGVKRPGFERRKSQKSKRAVVERAEGLTSNSACQIHTAAFEHQRPIIIDLK